MMGGRSKSDSVDEIETGDGEQDGSRIDTGATCDQSFVILKIRTIDELPEACKQRLSGANMPALARLPSGRTLLV